MTNNWDNKLRSATNGTKTIDLKYDPAGNRIWKDSSESGTRKFIVDTVGRLPVILMEIDTAGSLKKAYIYGKSQPLAQYDIGTYTGDWHDSADLYFYMHDRIGSVRQIIDTAGQVARNYTYSPFGKTLEAEGTLTNPFMFTGQWYDSEIGQYYLRARMYDPELARFTGRDPVLGSFKEPMTLHAYLYCLNDPINRIDPLGERSLSELGATVSTWATSMAVGGYNFALRVFQSAQRLISQINLRNFVHRLASSGQKGLDLAVRLGKQGEYTAQNIFGFMKNTQRFFTSAGNYRIPDGVLGRMFFEVKNVQYLSLTAQIRDLIEITAANNGILTLVVRAGTGTQLSKALQVLEANGTIIIERLL